MQKKYLSRKCFFFFFTYLSLDTYSTCWCLPQAETVGITALTHLCQVTGKRPVTGNNVSHAKNRTRRRFLPNLHQHRFWIESEKRFVTLRVSSKGMRIIDKKGIEQVLEDIRARGEKV